MQGFDILTLNHQITTYAPNQCVNCKRDWDQANLSDPWMFNRLDVFWQWKLRGFHIVAWNLQVEYPIWHFINDAITPINVFRCGAGDSILNIAAFSTVYSCWLMQTRSAKVFWGHSHKLCVTPVTQHQTMETLSVMTSASPNSQTKGLNSRPPKKTHLKHDADSPPAVCVWVSVCMSWLQTALSSQEGQAGLCWHPWVEKIHTLWLCPTDRSLSGEATLTFQE